MAPNKIENQFREKLQEREIKPSSGSWEQLQDKLDSSSRKRSKNSYWLAGLAASVIGGIIVLGLIFKNAPIEETPSVVNTPSEEINKKEELILEKQFIAVEEENVTKTPEAVEVKKERVPNVQKQPIKDLPVLAVNEYDTVKNETDSETRALPDFKEESISKILEEVIAEISANEKEHKDATDEEIEELLYNAAVAISREQNTRNSAGGIDAGDLLYDVEMEIEQSFREKVFEILKEGYSKARTAVATRNN